MSKREALLSLVDPKKIALLEVLLFSSEEMYLKEIADKSHVPLASAFRLLQEFTQLGLIKKRSWKTSTIYSCENNEKVLYLKELLTDEYEGLREFVQSMSTIPEIQNIIVHGVQKKNKANVLVIGQGIEPAKIEAVREQLKQKGFELTYLTLTPEQYEQMSKMGLYSGEKMVLK